MYSDDTRVDPVLHETLARLEETLWRSETRYDDSYMEHVFAEDFFEFGRSGRTYNRSDLLVGASGRPEIKAKLPLAKFSARHLTQDVIQTTYVSEVMHGGEVQYANRSSIWTRQSGEWKLRFHQGTPTVS